LKKILIIQETLIGGGAEKVLVNLLNNIDYTKYKVDLLVLIKYGVHLENINKNVNVKSIFTPIKFKNEFFNKLQKRFFYKSLENLPEVIINFFLKDKYDYQIAFLEGLCTNILSKAKAKKGKKVAWVHIDLEKYKKLPQEIENECYKAMDEIICVSKDVKEVVDRLYPDVSEKTKVIYNLMDKEDILIKSNEKIEYNENKPTIIGIGRLAPQKRFDLLIKAHREVIESGIDNKLLILGSGDLKEELEALIDELDVRDTVEIKEFVKNPYSYIKRADMLVMSSDFEGFSLVVGEAMILGKCIVSTKCAGPIELLDNGQAGQLVECGDLAGLVNAIKNLLEDKEKREFYEKRALERSEIFDSEEIMKEIYKVIK